jgi:hypothetical protein
MKKDYDANSREQIVKGWAEIFLTPLVLAVVGGLGTFFITTYQIKSAEKIASAQLSSSVSQSQSEQQVKLLEIFVSKFTSGNPKERLASLKLLRLANPEFAEKMASTIAGDESEEPNIRQQAQQVSEQVRASNYFAIVATFAQKDNAFKYAQDLRQRGLTYKPEIYLRRDNNLYIVTLGGYLQYDEAKQRVDYAKAVNIASDSYVRFGDDWGQNLSQ